MAYRFGPVVVGVDGSPDSIGALRWAADAACRWNRTLTAVTAVSRDDDHDGQLVATGAAAEAARWQVGVEATGCTRRGAPIDVLRGYAVGARLVVVGGRGTGAGDGKPLGTVSQALCTRADAPVLIVHDGGRWAAPDATMPRHGPVVTGFDGSDSARGALRTAFEEAASRCSRLVILQAWPHPGLRRPGDQRGADLRAEETAVHQARPR
jgi:nucleotide-binding universal stress UspA family protein